MVNTIIWQYTFLGVEVNGAANLLSGVHAWGSGCGQFDYLTGIKVNSYQNRIVDSYLDYNYLDLMAPTSISVESTFFLGTNTRIFGSASPGSSTVTGLFMARNLGDSVQVVGNITSCTGSSILNQAGPLTEATKAITLTNATHFVFDFTTVLVFGSINSVLYSVASAAGDVAGFMPRHVSRQPVGKTVVVEFEKPVSATVHMKVAQCL